MSNNKEAVKELTDRLECGLDALFNSKQYTDYLNMEAKFHNYSVNNIILIALQCPEASRVAGFGAWKKNFNRNVKKGEKAIQILAPVVHKREVKKPESETDSGEEETKEVKWITYRRVNVFDVSQTEGDPLPELGVNELKGNVKEYKRFLEALQQESPVLVSYEDVDGGAKGYFSKAEKKIVVQKGMSEAQTIKTLIHEITHAKLHSEKNEKSSRTKEVEAESVAYIVGQRYGIDTSDYSFGYIAGWSSGKDRKELKNSLNTICATAAEIIDALDARLLAESKTA